LQQQPAAAWPSGPQLENYAMQEAVIPNQAQTPAQAPAVDAIIRAEKIEKYYAQPSQNRIQVISATDLSIVPGEILALLGPSGSGKSTMLRMLTGLSTPSAGQVYWHEKPIAGAEINVSIVFQSFALFPWLTVLENVEAPLQARGVSPEDRRERSMKMLDTVGLDGFEGAYPKELSGGMRQRVGFARALVVEPEVLFMDEPFSALDVLTAENLRSELLELWANKTMPTKAVFLVTHNIEEAVLLADRIIVLGRNPGHIRTDFKVQLAQPRDRKSEPFTQLVDYIYKVLTKPDVAPDEAPDHQHPGTRVRDQRQMHYQMRPHARPGGMAGLLELLLDKGGRDDIYHLADDLAFEIDDLLPIVDAAQLLGFLKIEEGDAAITESGTEFANSEILRQKEVFRDAAVKNVLLLRQIRRALESKSDHTIPEDFFLDMLDEQFSEEECLRQMETAVAWGRYAELFDFDAGRRRFVLPDAQDEEVAASGDAE
jgi:NitT/TauT family transport system ATP-binding protein